MNQVNPKIEKIQEPINKELKSNFIVEKYGDNNNKRTISKNFWPIYIGSSPNKDGYNLIYDTNKENFEVERFFMQYFYSEENL